MPHASFSQAGKTTNNDWKKTAKCHHCGKIGHIKPDCPEKKKNTVHVTIKEGAFHQDTNYRRGMRNMILLDNQSTLDVVQNWDLVSNIQETVTAMHIPCSVGHALPTRRQI